MESSGDDEDESSEIDGDGDDENRTRHYLKPRVRVLVSNDLEVSDVSSITCVELLRRHSPDPNRWEHFLGIALEVDEDDFRAIARSALAGRSCVLQDALGPKATATFEKKRATTHVDATKEHSVPSSDAHSNLSAAHIIKLDDIDLQLCKLRAALSSCRLVSSRGAQTADSACDAQPSEPVHVRTTAADVFQTVKPLIDLDAELLAEPLTPGTPTASNDSFDMFDSDGL